MPDHSTAPQRARTEAIRLTTTARTLSDALHDVLTAAGDEHVPGRLDDVSAVLAGLRRSLDDVEVCCHHLYDWLQQHDRAGVLRTHPTYENEDPRVLVVHAGTCLAIASTATAALRDVLAQAHIPIQDLTSGTPSQ